MNLRVDLPRLTPPTMLRCVKAMWPSSRTMQTRSELSPSDRSAASGRKAGASSAESVGRLESQWAGYPWFSGIRSTMGAEGAAPVSEPEPRQAGKALSVRTLFPSHESGHSRRSSAFLVMRSRGTRRTTWIPDGSGTTGWERGCGASARVSCRCFDRPVCALAPRRRAFRRSECEERRTGSSQRLRPRSRNCSCGSAATS